MSGPHPVVAAHDLAVEGVTARGPGRTGVGRGRSGRDCRRGRRGLDGRGLDRGGRDGFEPGPGQVGSGHSATDASENLTGMVQNIASNVQLRPNYMQNQTGMTISVPIVNIFRHIRLAPCNGRRIKI